MNAYKHRIFFLCLLIAACHDRKTPNIKVLNGELGISIPAHTVPEGRSDPFGVGLDDREEYVLQFDSTNFALLENRIRSSFLFDLSSKGGFDQMQLREKVDFMRQLSEKKLTSFWVESGDTYLFNCDSIRSRFMDNVYDYLPAQHIYFPNQDSTRISNGMAMTVYVVKAVADRKRRTLYFQYTHI